MKYFKQYIDETQAHEVDYNEALKTVLKSYEDNEMTRQMLTQPGEIRCMVSTITIVED